MNTKYITLLFATLAVATAPCLAQDAGETQKVALLVGPTAHMTPKEPAIQKAIEVLKKDLPQQIDLKKLPARPDAPIGHFHNDKIYILGGPEVVPM